MSKKHKKSNNNYPKKDEVKNDDVLAEEVKAEENANLEQNVEENNEELKEETGAVDVLEEANETEPKSEEPNPEEVKPLEETQSEEVTPEETESQEPEGEETKPEEKEPQEEQPVENSQEEVNNEPKGKKKKNKKNKKQEELDETLVYSNEPNQTNEELAEANYPKAKEDKYKVMKYLSTQQYFSFKELENLFIYDLEKEGSDLFDLYQLAISYRSGDLYNILGLIFYFASVKDKALRDKMVNELGDKDFKAIYYHACKFAIRYKDDISYKEFIALIKNEDNKSIYLDILPVYHRNNVYTFEEDDRSYKQGCKLAKLLSRGKNLDENERNALFLASMEAYGNPYNEDINKGVKIFNNFRSGINQEIVDYILLLLGQNYIMHYEYEKADRLFKRVSEACWFSIGKYMLLVKNKVRTYEELVVSKPYRDSQEFKDLEEKSYRTKDKAIIERFEEFSQELGEVKDLRKDRLYDTIRKAVYIMAFVLYALTFILNHYIRTIGLKILDIMCGLGVMGITLLHTDTFKNFKKYLTPVIVFGVIGLIMIIIAIIL